MAPPSGEQVFFHGHPSWLSMLALIIKGVLIAIAIGALTGGGGKIADGKLHTSWIVLAVLVVLVIVAVIGTIRRLSTTYTITDQRLTIVTGLLSRDVHETRLERVQNVNSKQSLIQRLLGIGTVEFDTAGSADYDFAFRGVAHPRQIVRTVDEAIQQLGARTPAADV